jgi:hypothetical protein
VIEHESITRVAQTLPPGELVAVYAVMELPPFEPGDAQDTRIDDPVADALTVLGAPGTVAGVTLLDGLDSGPAPTPLVAWTVNV